MSATAAGAASLSGGASSVPDEFVGLLSSLVAIDSVNPSLIDGAPGEAEIAAFAAAWLRRHSVNAVVEEAAPGRPNVIARAGRGGAGVAMLNVHTDTVGVDGMTEPFTPVVRDGRLYGRGAADTKAGLAAAMWTLAHAGDVAGEAVLTAVADEEWGSVGTQAVASSMRADACVVIEPTGLVAGVAHRGFAAVEVLVHGRAAHGSMPHEGVDAIAKAGRFLAAFDDHCAALMARDADPLVGPPSAHASLISGGQEWSSYPRECSIKLERRTVPGETPDAVLAEVREVCDRVARDDESFRADVKLHFSRDPFASAEAPLASDALGAAFESALGRRVVRAGLPYWTDAGLLVAVGVPCVVFGPAGGGLHGVDEWVDLDSAWECALVLEQFVRLVTDRRGT